MENEDIMYGYTGIKTDCKTRAWSPSFIFFLQLFLKMYDRIKNIRSYKTFAKTSLCQYTLLFCWPNKSLWDSVYGVTRYQN